MKTMEQIGFRLRLGTALFALTLMLFTASSGIAASLVPFKASITANLSFSGNSTFSLIGFGNELIASHMGKIGYSAEGMLTGTLSTSPLTLTDTLIETLVAANGDTLTLECHQILTLDGATGILHGVDSSRIIGGTGRFSQAAMLNANLPPLSRCLRLATRHRYVT